MAQAAAKQAAKTVTKWDAFRGLRPTKLLCEGYLPVHTVNSGCHTQLPVEGRWMAIHTRERQHSGGFHITLEPGESEFWAECAEAGLEIVDFRCGVCGKRLKPMAAAVMPHLRPHADPNRKMQPGGLFFITVGDAPSVDDEALEE